MTQEEKDLLVKDLCARLPYNLIVQIDGCGVWDLRGVDHDDSSELRDRVIVWHGKNYPSSKNSFPIINCKPYLFPLSSMTEEQRNEYNNLCSVGTDECGDIIYFDTYESIDYLNKNKFDYRYLIPMGLAIDATRLNIY